MSELLPALIFLVCPIGMAAMMGLPALGRWFAQRAKATNNTQSTSPSRRDHEIHTAA